MTKIGFVGLGRMGRPMAKHILKSGADVTVHSASSRAYAELERAGARTTSRLADLAGSDVLFLCLPDGDVVTQVLFGDAGIARHLGAGRVVVDLGTTSYSATLEIGRTLADKGVAFLDAPVSGMEARAIEGTLTVMCGGPRATFDAVRPYLECLGNKIVYMGGLGSGQLSKLINQALFNIGCAALAEMLPMAVKMGLDPAKVGEVVNSGTGSSYASRYFVPRILDGDFSSGYPMKQAYKDLISAADIGARLCIPMPVLAAATATYQSALLKGLGGLDKGAMIRVFEDLLGVRVRRHPEEAVMPAAH